MKYDILKSSARGMTTRTAKEVKPVVARANSATTQDVTVRSAKELKAAMAHAKQTGQPMTVKLHIPPKRPKKQTKVNFGSTNPVQIAGEVKRETDKAYGFFDGVHSVWLPKSQCQFDTQKQTMTLPNCLAMEKGLI